MRERRGTVAIMFAFLTPVLMGSLALGFETSNWYVTKRNQQNAADAAAIAAATNGGTNYAAEAKAVAANYGYVDGADDVTVTASNSATCPSGGNTCYSGRNRPDVQWRTTGRFLGLQHHVQCFLGLPRKQPQRRLW